MSIEEVSPEQFAKLFHHYHEVLVADSTGRRESHSEAWSEIPVSERHRMVVAARLAFLELASVGDEENERSRYFAKPGQAEWGC
jgi:hypothetical protein